MNTRKVSISQIKEGGGGGGGGGGNDIQKLTSQIVYIV